MDLNSINLLCLIKAINHVNIYVFPLLVDKLIAIMCYY